MAYSHTDNRRKQTNAREHAHTHNTEGCTSLVERSNSLPGGSIYGNHRVSGVSSAFRFAAMLFSALLCSVPQKGADGWRGAELNGPY